MKQDNELALIDIDDEDDNEVKIILNNGKEAKKLSKDRFIGRTFEDITLEDHKEISIKVLKHWLKNYYKLDGLSFPQSSILKQEDIVAGNSNSGDTFCMKMDIEAAINTLPLRLKKIIYLHYIIGFPVGKICLMLGFKFRVDLYRRLEECFDAIYLHLGKNWLRERRREE